jgi:hypothetical protein
MNDGFSHYSDGEVPAVPAQLPEDDLQPVVIGDDAADYADTAAATGYGEVETDAIGMDDEYGDVSDVRGDISDVVPAVPEPQLDVPGPSEPEEATERPAAHLEYRGETEARSGDFPDTDLYDRVRSLGLPQDEIVVISSGVVEVVVGPDVRRAADIDLAVTEDVYRYLREQPGVEEVVHPETGEHRLQGNDIDVGLGWRGANRTMEQLQADGFTSNGVNFASLPTVYEYKQGRGEPKDHRDLEIIRNHLYGDKPLPPAMLKQEREFVEGLLPDHLHGRPEVQVAANGLHVVRTVFGDEAGSVRAYTGPVEHRPVPATYHAWHHTANGLDAGQRNMAVANAEAAAEQRPESFTDTDRLAHAAGYANHDAILGHGRQAANPDAHDERQSADMAVRHLEARGVTDSELLEKTHATVMATTFSEARKAQNIDPGRGHIRAQEAGAASDMSAFRNPDGPLGAVRLTTEDLCRVGAGYDQPLNRLADELNANLQPGERPVRITSARDGMALIDQHPDFQVTKIGPDGPHTMTLREAAATHLAGSAGFMEKYQFPDSWRLGTREQQAQNAACMRDLSDQLRAGKITAVQALEIAERYAALPL